MIDDASNVAEMSRKQRQETCWCLIYGLRDYSLLCRETDAVSTCGVVFSEARLVEAYRISRKRGSIV